MTQPAASRAAVIKRNAQLVVQQNIVNVNAKIRTLDPTKPSEKGKIDKLRKILYELINELERIINARFKDLNNHPDIDRIITNLGDSAKAAQAESERLKNTAERIASFNAMLSNITRLVGGLVQLAV